MSPNDANPAAGVSAAAPTETPPPAPRRWRALPIAAVLSLSLGLFVMLAVGVELAVSYVGARRTAYELLRDRTVGTLDSVV